MPSVKLIPYELIEDQTYYGETEVNVSNSDFTDVIFKDNQMTISFFNCRFIDLKIINSEQINFEEISFYFHGCIINNINIEFISTDNISLHFYSCLLSGVVRNENIKKVDVNNCILIDSLFLIKQKSVSLSYTEENIFVRVWKKVFAATDIVSLEGLLKQKQSFYIYESQTINVRMNEIEDKRIGLYSQSYHQIEDYKIAYHLSAYQKTLLDISVYIDYSSTVKDAKTNILNCTLHNLSLRGTSTGPMLIENVRIDNWYINEFLPKEETTFFLISPSAREGEKKLGIQKSNLDKVWFDNIDFSKYNIVSFYRTRFGKTLFTGCDFPTDYTSFETFKSLENIHYPDKLPDNYYKNQYEIFLQLKSVLESTGNTYEAQKVQSVSNEVLRKVKHLSWSDKTILFLNSASNKHGISIKNPFWGFVGVSIVLYVLYLLSLGRIFNQNPIDWQLIGYYFSFIDITHRTDFLVNKKHFTFGSLFIDFFSKLFLSFLIYQFIAAFRKYGKK